MPPRRSSRTSISSPTSGGMDDVSYLTLAEVKERLNRNQNLLNSPLFSSVSPPTSPNINIGVGVAGPSTTSLSPIRTSDPVKDKLILAREALLAREQDLMMGNMKVKDEYSDNHYLNGQGNENGNNNEMIIDQEGRRKSASSGAALGGRSGKARVLNKIREDECKLAKNGLILPIDQTLHLGQRDYENATALSLSHLTLNQTRSSSPKPRRPLHSHQNSKSNSSKSHNDLFSSNNNDGEDEISRANRLARLNAFMSYKPSLSDEDEDFENEDEEDGYDEDDEINENDKKYINNLNKNVNLDEDEKNFQLTGPASGGYDGNGNSVNQDERMIDDIGQEIDEYGEDDEVFAEGNDEYGNGTGLGSLAAGPGR